MTALKSVASYFLNCPKCSCDIPSPHGSLMWVPGEETPSTVTCPDCGEELRTPKIGR